MRVASKSWQCDVFINHNILSLHLFISGSFLYSRLKLIHDSFLRKAFGAYQACLIRLGRKVPSLDTFVTFTSMPTNLCGPDAQTDFLYKGFCQMSFIFKDSSLQNTVSKILQNVYNVKGFTSNF